MNWAKIKRLSWYGKKQWNWVAGKITVKFVRLIPDEFIAVWTRTGRQTEVLTVNPESHLDYRQGWLIDWYAVI